MATTDYPVNHPLAVKLWSKQLFHDIIGESYVGKFTGKTDSAMIQIKTETQKSAGDRITMGLRTLLSGNGIQGDGTLEGNEEALTTYSDQIYIDQIRHAVRTAGRMSEQRVLFDVREEARMGLKDWWTERMETSLANQLTGYTTQSNTLFTGNNATIAPTATSRIIAGGGHATEASLSATTTHAVTLADLDRAVTIAKVATAGGAQRIRPLRIAGKDHYVAFLHPYQIYQMRRDASTQGNLWDLLRAQLQGSDIKDNPLVTGASFMYNNVIVHEWSYLPNTVSAPSSQTNYRRGVFCGAQAASLAFGQNNSENRMTWEEDLFDYGNQFGVSAGMIFGAKKNVFNSTDFGTIVLAGYAPAP